jgi:hypothetical protein
MDALYLEGAAWKTGAWSVGHSPSLEGLVDKDIWFPKGLEHPIKHPSYIKLSDHDRLYI